MTKDIDFAIVTSPVDRRAAVVGDRREAVS
jgi:hypothetical protein